jgi:hypothetical protein
MEMEKKKERNAMASERGRENVVDLGTCSRRKQKLMKRKQLFFSAQEERVDGEITICTASLSG